MHKASVKLTGQRNVIRPGNDRNVPTEGGLESRLSFSDLVLGQLLVPHSVVNEVPKGFWIKIFFYIPNCPECSECPE